MRLQFQYPPGKNPNEWRREYHSGNRPDELLYGVHHFTDLGVSLEPTAQSSVKVSAVLRSLLHRARKPCATYDLSCVLTWEEQSALRAVLSGVRPDRLVTGVIWSTEPSSGRSPAIQKAHRAVLKRAAGVWCLARPQVEVLRDYLGEADLGKFHFLRFGIDTAFFTPLTSASAPTEPKVIFSAGIDRHRDYHLLADAIRKIKQQRSEIRAVVQVPGGESLATDIEVSPRLTHREMVHRYREASVVVIATSPNLHVSGMTVALEAQASGCPVVVTGTPGFDDYVQHGVTGYIVDHDPDSIAEHALNIIENPELRSAMSVAASKYVRDEHSSRQMIESLLSFVKARIVD